MAEDKNDKIRENGEGRESARNLLGQHKIIHLNNYTQWLLYVQRDTEHT